MTALSLALLFALGAPQQPHTTCDKLPNAGSLCIRSDEGKSSRWTIRRKGGGATVVKTPQTSLMFVSEVSVSPDGRYVAIISVGEGHPILDVFDLKAVLASRAPEPLVTVNPYPGTIVLAGWSSGALVVRSDVALTLPQEKREDVSEELKEFRVALPGGAITPVP